MGPFLSSLEVVVRCDDPPQIPFITAGLENAVSNSMQTVSLDLDSHPQMVIPTTEDFDIFANRKSKQTCKLANQIDDSTIRLGCDIRSDWLIYMSVLTSYLQ